MADQMTPERWAERIAAELRAMTLDSGHDDIISVRANDVAAMTARLMAEFRDAEVDRLSSEADRLEADRDRLKGERDHRESLWRDEHFLRKAAELRADQAEAERDNARADAKRLNVLARDLNSLVEELRADWQRVNNERAEAKAERDEAREQVKRVRDRHPRKTDDADCVNADTTFGCQHGPGYHTVEYCGTCDDEWPCAEIRALDGTEDGQ